MPDAPLPPLPPAGQPQWRTSLDELRRRVAARPAAVLTAVVVTVAVCAVIAGVVLLRPGRQVSLALPSAVPAPAEPAPADGPSARAAGRQDPGGGEEEVVVDVAGAVGRPGLVRLRAGSRVADAVAAAGGATADADVASLNQARVLADGEQVRVPRVGEPPPPPPPPAGPTRPGGSRPGGAGALVDLNRATADELDALPGVGPATATAIITWRTENGGFRRVDDLLEVPGIGPARLERLRPLVRV